MHLKSNSKPVYNVVIIIFLHVNLYGSKSVTMFPEMLENWNFTKYKRANI